MFFCMKNRNQIMQQNPNAALPEISKLLGRSWSALEDAGKAPYEAQAEADRLRYESEMETFVPEFGEFRGGSIKLTESGKNSAERVAQRLVDSVVTGLVKEMTDALNTQGTFTHAGLGTMRVSKRDVSADDRIHAGLTFLNTAG